MTELLRRCAQCWKEKPLEAFVGKRGQLVQWCDACRRKYRQPYGTRASEPRRGLPVMSDGPPHVLWSERSGNVKLGGMPSCIVSGDTCPTSCAFYGDGCFAEFGMLGHHWRRAGAEGLAWEGFLDRLRALPADTLWRYAVAGDLPGVGDELDVVRTAELIHTNFGRRGFAFTHKPLRSPLERRAIHKANSLGFVVNLSASTLEEADAKLALQVGPVAVVLPLGTTAALQTPAGHPVLLCRFETHGVTCADCGLCARPHQVIVGFIAHGQMKARVSVIASGSKTTAPTGA